MLSAIYLAFPLIAYLVIVRQLRYRRIRNLEKQYGANEQQFVTLNYKDAQTIIGQMALFECPWIFLSGKDFAFLRAFAIPSISKVSVQAKEMTDRVGKRYADTTVLVGEFLINDIDSERACIALNRMNWIHAQYRSKIQMDQMVYTLCLLCCEALQWIDKYDWRKTTALEKHASYVFWFEVGKRMGLEGVPESYNACAVYIRHFEEKEMAPSSDNEKIADGVFHLYASTMPSFLAPLVKAIIVSFMDNQLRTAFKIQPSTSFIQKLLSGLLKIRKIFVRHLMLPRYHTAQIFGDAAGNSLRNMAFYEIEPWYVKTSNNILFRTYTRFFKLPTAGDSKFRPEGYKLHEVGPQRLEGKGGDKVLDFVKSSGCAFSSFGFNGNKVYVPTRVGGSGCPMRYL